MLRPLFTGTPVVDDSTDPATFSWANGTIAASLSQATRGAQDLIAAQIKSGAINGDSSITVRPDNTFTLHITKDVLFQTVTVDCEGTVGAGTDAAGNAITVFSMTNGTVDSGGLADAAQITSQLTTWVGNWEKQAQLEPVAPAFALPGE